jgi:hypothetical protein
MEKLGAFWLLCAYTPSSSAIAEFSEMGSMRKRLASAQENDLSTAFAIDCRNNFTAAEDRGD